MLLLQSNFNPANSLPTLPELVKYYGPYLGLIIGLVLAISIMQFVWFRRILRAKDAEIKRLVERENALNERLLHMIDQEIGYRKKMHLDA